MNTELNRRHVLIGLAAASGAAASVKAGETAHAKEAQELLKLGNTLSKVEARYWSAKKRLDDILKEVFPLWPKAPEEIRYWFGGAKPETDITGVGILRPWSEDGKITRVMNYAPPEAVENAIKQHQKKIAHILATRSKRELKSETLWLERMEEALPLSRFYVAEIKRIRQSSGYEAASEAKTEARANLLQHVDAIMKAKPRGMEGVVIQAQALAAWQSMDLADQMDLKAMKWLGRLAETILKQGAEA